MKITELIAQLEAVRAEQGDLRVLISGRESGLDDFDFDCATVCLGPYSGGYFGQYVVAGNPAEPTFTAVTLTRNTDY